MFTFLNIDALLESLKFWRQKTENQSNETDDKTPMHAGLYIPSTAIFRDGELVEWYTGGFASQIKRKRREALRGHKALIEAFCKTAQTAKPIYGIKEEDMIVAILVCCKPSNVADTELVQCRMLNEKKFESVVQGSKANRLNGYILQYRGSQQNQQFFECLWTGQSFNVERVDASKIECFQIEYKPARIHAMKKLMPRIKIKHLDTQGSTIPRIRQDHHKLLEPAPTANLSLLPSPRNCLYKPKVSCGFTRKKPKQQRSDIPTIPVQIREIMKMSCAKIVSVMQEFVASSTHARLKAQYTARVTGNMSLDMPFEAVQMISAFFCLGHDDAPFLVYCGVLTSHSSVTFANIQEAAREELQNPSEKIFSQFCAQDVLQTQHASVGRRNRCLNLNEFLRLLRSLDILYQHVSVTMASQAFEQYCTRLEGGESQLDYEAYVRTMHWLARSLGILKGLARSGSIFSHEDEYKLQRSNSETYTAASSVDALLGSQFDLRQGYRAVKRFRDVERQKLARMFAQSIINKERIDALNAYYTERQRKHERSLAAKREKMQQALKGQRNVAEKRLQMASERVAEKRQAELEALEQKRARVQENVARFERERAQRKEEREEEGRIYRERRAAQLSAVRDMEDERRKEFENKTRLIEEAKGRVAERKAKFRDMRKRFWDQLGLERFVVGEVFEDYIRTGSLHRHWAAAELDGEALEVAVATVLLRTHGRASADAALFTHARQVPPTSKQMET